MKSTSETIYEIADRLRGIATMGLNYSQNEYDTDRYQRILDVSLGLVSLHDGRTVDELRREYVEDNWMHVSPMQGAEGVVLKEGKILLIQRTDNQLWCIPGGLVEIGETLAEAAERELFEETGVSGEATQLLGIFDSRKWNSNLRSQMFHSIFLVETPDPTPSLSNESLAADFFSKDELPALSPGHDRRVPVVFELLTGSRPIPFFDR